MWRSLTGLMLSIALIGGTASMGQAGPLEDCNQTKDLDRTVRGCSDLIRRAPGNAVALANRGLAYVAKDDYKRAVIDLDAAIRLSPRNAAFHFSRCTAYVGRGYAFGDERDVDRGIADCDEAERLGLRDSAVGLVRGVGLGTKGDYVRALADLDEAVRRKPRDAAYHAARAAIYGNKGDYDRALAGMVEAIRLSPADARHHATRAVAYAFKGEQRLALADLRTAMTLRAKDSFVRHSWGFVHLMTEDYAEAIAGYTDAIALLPEYAEAFAGRGYAYYKQGDVTRALQDLNDAIAVKASFALAHAFRGAVYEAKGEPAKATQDYWKALSLPARSAWERRMVAKVQPRLVALEGAKVALMPMPAAPGPALASPLTPTPASPPPAAVTAVRPADVKTALADATTIAHGRRVALVIGNSDYRIGPLQNPGNDASAVAETLSETLRFDKVILRLDVGADGFRAALRELAREAAGASLGLVYYAGHGTEVGGKNFLIPVDARLARAGDLNLEAIPLETVLEQLTGVTTLKLVILDACRNNVFPLASTSRSIGRGLSRIEPEDNTLVFYAAKDGTTADDGIAGRHSPFTAALLKHISTPGLEIRFLLGAIRDDVMTATGRAQQPYVYGTLGASRIYLRKAE